MTTFPKPKTVMIGSTVINLDKVILVTKTEMRINWRLWDAVVLWFNFLDDKGEPYKYFKTGPEAMAFYEWYSSNGMRF